VTANGGDVMKPQRQPEARQEVMAASAVDDWSHLQDVCLVNWKTAPVFI